MAGGTIILTREQGQVLLGLAFERGYSQADLASRAGIDPSNLSKILHRSGSITPKTRAKLETALGIPLGSLIPKLCSTASERPVAR